MSRIDKHNEERNRIDQEIRKLQGRILELCVARNRLTPVAQLPNELLTKIFWYAKHMSNWPRGWTSLAVSWVCRDWRAAALGYPPLWTYIDHHNPEWITEFLRRSGTGKLCLVLPSLGSKGLAKVPLILESLPRVVGLDIGAATTNYACGNEWDAPAPLLTQLTLRKLSFTNIFSGIYPCLRSLTLVACLANYLPLTPNLTVLTIINPRFRLTPTHVVGILQDLPLLETLLLAGVLQSDDGVLPNNLPRLLLQSLRSLVLRQDSCICMIALFPRLSLPPSAQIQLQGLYSEDPEDFSDTILAVQESRLNQSWQINQLKIEVGSNFYLCICDTNTMHHSSVQFTFPLPTILAEDFVTQHLMDICHSLHLATLCTLDIRGKLGPYEPALWRHTLGSLPNLQCISVHGRFSTHFLRYLKEEAGRLVSADQMKKPLGSSQNRPTFRMLRALKIGDLRHTPPNYDGIAQLQWVLGPRKIYLERLPRLVLCVNSLLPSDVISSFSHVVVEVFQEIVPPSPIEQDDINIEDENNDEEEEED